MFINGIPCKTLSEDFHQKYLSTFEIRSFEMFIHIECADDVCLEVTLTTSELHPEVSMLILGFTQQPI